MNHRIMKLYFVALLLLLACTDLAGRGDAQKADASWKREIPKPWVGGEITALEIPLSDPASSPKHIPADYYYRIPCGQSIRAIRSMRRAKSRPGYVERLSRLEPEIVSDASKLKTEQDWIKPGELVFDAPIATGSLSYLTPGVLPDERSELVRENKSAHCCDWLAHPASLEDAQAKPRLRASA